MSAVRSILVSLVAVAILGIVAYGGAAAGLNSLFGIVLPYVALALFLGGMILKVLKWAKSPVPFRIPTTCGQQKSLPWIQHNALEAPFTKGQVYLRMILEVLFFRSLFRNTKAEIKDGSRVVYSSDKLLWAAGLAFHYSFLYIVIRHLRFFLEPVPGLVHTFEAIDSFFEVGVPIIYATDLVFLGAVSFLFVRRVIFPQVRYISLMTDFFPLFLLLGIGFTGVWMRYISKVDIVGVKELSMGLVTFSPAVPETIAPMFFVHLTFVCALIAYFPFSKLTHMAGVFLSPTRNMANNSRAQRHINPWNPDVKLHTYDEWEDEFRDKMKAVGLPLEKE